VVGWRRLVATGAPEHSVPLRLWTLASVVVSIMAVTAHDDFLEHRLIVPTLVAAGFMFSYWRRGKRNWWVKLILAALCLQVGWQFLRDVYSNPFHTSVPLTVLLLWLQTLHSFDVPARRDLLFSLLSSVILMAVAAAFGRDMTYLLYLVPYALAAVHVLVHNSWQAAVEAAVPPGRAPGIATGAAAGWPTRGISGPAAGPRLQGMMPAANHLLIMVLLVAGVVFTLTPRYEGVRLVTLPFSPQRLLLDFFAGRIFNPAYPGGGDDGASQSLWNPRGYFGFGTTVDLRMRGRLDETVVMRVRSTHQFNWRALVFDTYTGSGWKISDNRVYEAEGRFPPISLAHRQDEILRYGVRPIRVTQSFFIEAEQPNVVFAAPVAESLYLSTARVYLDRYGAIRLSSTLPPGTVYSVVSRALIPDPGRLRGAQGEIPADLRARYLALPQIPGRVRDLALRLVADQPTAYDRVASVNRHLWAEYRYDLTIPPQRRPGDAVDYFLFEERRGYCEQFASAMVVLLRAAEIPARLVTGYAPGTLNPLTGLYEVRNSDAHAWVEVFFPGVGWVEFEPTPGFPDTATLGAPALRRWVWQDVAELLRARLQALAARSPAAARVLEAASVLAQGALWAGIALAGVLAVAGTRLIVGSRQASEMPGGGLGEIYRRMCAMLARRGWRRAPSETVEEFRQRVEASGPMPEVARLSALVEASVYGQEEPGAEVLAEARRHLDALGARLRKGHGPSR